MIKQNINELNTNDNKKLLIIKNKIEKYIKEGKYEEAIIYCKKKYEINIKNDCKNFNDKFKHEIVKLYNHYIVYLLGIGQSLIIKDYFKEINEYIGNDIFSYLITQNNFSCYLTQNNQIKQAKNTMNKILKIDIINHLSGIIDEEEQNSLSNIDKDYSSLSSLENNFKNYQNSLILSMESLALKQFETLYNNDNNGSIKYNNIDNDINVIDIINKNIDNDNKDNNNKNIDNNNKINDNKNIDNNNDNKDNNINNNDNNNKINDNNNNKNIDNNNKENNNKNNDNDGKDNNNNNIDNNNDNNNKINDNNNIKNNDNETYINNDNNNKVQNNKKKDNQLYLGYYLIGIQQEFLRRENDSVISFSYAKKYLNESKLKNSDKKHFDFIKQLQTKNNDTNQINFIDGFNYICS